MVRMAFGMYGRVRGDARVGCGRCGRSGEAVHMLRPGWLVGRACVSGARFAEFGSGHPFAGGDREAIVDGRIGSE